MLTATKLYLLLLNTYEVPQNQAAIMTCLALHESNLNIKAVNFNTNGTIDRGLFQINSIWPLELGIADVRLFELHTNIRVALHIWDVQGVKAWAVYKKCI